MYFFPFKSDKQDFTSSFKFLNTSFLQKYKLNQGKILIVIKNKLDLHKSTQSIFEPVGYFYYNIGKKLKESSRSNNQHKLNEVLYKPNKVNNPF